MYLNLSQDESVKETRIKDHKVIVSENIENQRKAVVYRANDIINKYLHNWKSFSVFAISNINQKFLSYFYMKSYINEYIH